MSEGREPTDLDGLTGYSGPALVEQLRDRIKDLYRADSEFAREVHRGVAMMILEEVERRLS